MDIMPNALKLYIIIFIISLFYEYSHNVELTKA